VISQVAFAVGARYALSRRSSISFISLIAGGGLALSVAVLVIVISVINGFERELEERVFGLLPHLSFYGRDGLVERDEDRNQLLSLPGVTGVAAFVQGVGLAAVTDRVSSVVITGVDPQSYRSVSEVFDFVPEGATLRAGEFGVMLGAGVARQLEVEVGDRVSLVLPSATVTPAGLFPRQKRFEVVAIIRSNSELDTRAAYIHRDDGRRLFRLGGRIHGYQLHLDDLFRAQELAALGLDLLGRDRVFARTWMRSHGNLYRAIGVQKTTMFVLLSFLVAVAAFNLVSTLVMVVDQRSGDVAILRTLGSDTGTVVTAFVLLGATLGLVGVGLGLLAGSGIALALPGIYSWASATFQLDLMNQYFVSYLPVEIRGSDLIGITATALLLCVVSTLYPAWRAAGLKPSEVLAHE
jgi:lipoprotein-releasing system permease protein